ncbi:MAG: hypothetical protein A2Z16_02720 [Chloroflexi bacterium RBG_16_54_18]|nr:MAG: hypothetical protein A2Z16_02720 [Chloroflexi bacterium RBG_16_54_18]
MTLNKDLSVVIQAGGQSRRMGQDKGLAIFLGQPLISRLVARLRPLAEELLVTTNQPADYAFLGVPLYSDLIPERGALGGLYTALSVASLPYVAVVACDMPFIKLELLEAQSQRLLSSHSDISILHTGEGLEPFHAVYRRDACLPHIRQSLDEDKWRVDAWFSQVKIDLFRIDDIRRYDPELLSFWNVNTPEELHQAELLAVDKTR